LLGRDEPVAFGVAANGGSSPFVVICDHAGRRLPRKLGMLDLSARELASHLAWDLGAGQVARMLATELDAFVAWQPYSRLVIDCNRPLSAADSIPRQSERLFIPGNQNLLESEVEARVREIFVPYHEVIRLELDRRTAAGLPSILVSIHSFAPVFLEVFRPVKIGVLFNRDERLAKPLTDLLRAEGDLAVGYNEPYAAKEASDFSIVAHGEKRGIVPVQLELRQDLIADAHAQSAWAKRLARLLVMAAQ